MASTDRTEAPDETGVEQRHHPRRRVLQKALIVFNNGNCTMGCHILDMSDTGAKLMPADIILCPGEFVLKPQNGEPRHCAVMWRKATQVGVRYVELEHQPEVPDDERRNHHRRRALQKALIVYNNGRSSMGCQILDISETGAKLVPADIFLCPREFVLKPQSSGPRQCAVIWRKNSQIGVRYI